MKLADIMSETNWKNILEEMLAPKTSRPPNDKGADAIRVDGYVVHGHWRKRAFPVRMSRKLRRVK
jgi:hypothetical protein